jgi:hypothetical protein
MKHSSSALIFDQTQILYTTIHHSSTFYHPRESSWPNKCVSETDKYPFCSNCCTLGRESFPKTRYIPKRQGPKCVEHLFLRRTTTESFRNQAARKFLLKRSDGSKMLAWASRPLRKPLTAHILVCFSYHLWCTYCSRRFRVSLDKKCPFTSDISIRGRILTGKVVSTKMNRTIIIRRDYLHYIPKYSVLASSHLQDNSFHDCRPLRETPQEFGCTFISSVPCRTRGHRHRW